MYSVIDPKDCYPLLDKLRMQELASEWSCAHIRSDISYTPNRPILVLVFNKHVVENRLSQFG